MGEHKYETGYYAYNIPLEEARRLNREAQRKHKRKKLGLNNEQWEAMFDAQGRRCKTCRTDTPGGRGDWHTDHCSDTGRVRGILCYNCNVGIGHAKHDPAITKAWTIYLRKK